MKDKFDIFLKHGCLSQEAIYAYATRKLSAKESQRVSSHLGECELCHAALEGVEAFDEPQQYLTGSEQLTKEWKKKRANTKLGKTLVYALLSAAAAVVLIISLSKLTSLNMGGIFSAQAQPEAGFRELEEMILAENTPVKQRALIADEAIQEKLNRTKAADENAIEELEQTTPVAQLSSASVFSDDKIQKADEYISQQIEMEILAQRKSYIKYPYRVMGSAPANLVMNYPEEKIADDTFFHVEDMPKFKGQEYSAFLEFIHENLSYPNRALFERLSGRVYVQFTVDKNGQVTNSKVISGNYNLLNQEVLRVVNESPDWEPGRQRGRAVDVSLIIPVDFVLR